MRAILLAAGNGTRLRPISNYLPKCMVPIQGIPLIMIWVDMLVKSNIERILINLHSHSQIVQSAFQNSPYKDKVDFVCENELLGTGGTILKNSAFCSGQDVFIAHADNLSSFSFSNFLQTHKNRIKNCEMTMMTFVAPDPKACGIVELDQNGVVVAFFEKVKNPPSRLANGAVYIVSPKFLDEIRVLGKEQFDISLDVIPKFLGRIQSFQNTDFHRDIGNPDAYADAARCFHFEQKPSFRPNEIWWSDLLGESQFVKIRSSLSLS